MKKPTKFQHDPCYNYHEIINYIKEKYPWDNLKSTTPHNNIGYHNFWHWFLKDVNYEDTHNGSFSYLPITKEGLKDRNLTPDDWIKEILGYIQTEFPDGVDKTGYMMVWVEW